MSSNATVLGTRHGAKGWQGGALAPTENSSAPSPKS